jgi:hypothetical protein
MQLEYTLMPSGTNPGRLEMNLPDSAAVSANENAGEIQRPCKVVSRGSVDQGVPVTREKPIRGVRGVTLADTGLLAGDDRTQLAWTLHANLIS